MWKPPDVKGRRGRWWELKGETKEGKKNPGREVSKHRQKVSCWVTYWNGKGRQARERGGLTTHTEEARLRVGVVQERDSVGRGTSHVTWDDGKERISHVTWDNRKERIQKDFLACLLQFLHKKAPKPGSEHRGAWDFLHNTKLGSNLQLQ